MFASLLIRRENGTSYDHRRCQVDPGSKAFACSVMGEVVGKGRIDMSQDQITIEGSDLLRAIKIGIRMPRMLGPRFWIAIQLFRLAGWVSGTNVVVEVDDDLAEDAGA